MGSFFLLATEKNSVITSRGIPIVSGTFRYTKTIANAHTVAYIPHTAARPIEFSNTGRLYVTMILLVQYVIEQIAMQTPRTLVGNISEQRIFGTGPNPIT